MRQIIAIILDDPKAFIMDGISLLLLFACWLTIYILACFMF